MGVPGRAVLAQQGPLLVGTRVEIDRERCTEEHAGSQQREVVVIDPAEVQQVSKEAKVECREVRQAEEREGCGGERSGTAGHILMYCPCRAFSLFTTDIANWAMKHEGNPCRLLKPLQPLKPRQASFRPDAFPARSPLTGEWALERDLELAPLVQPISRWRRLKATG
eukprot:364378-Chlamydomonas_euryale.AAC.15